MYYLALNKGSSSLKFSLFDQSENVIISGKLTNYMEGEYKFVYTYNQKEESLELNSSLYQQGAINIINLILELKIITSINQLEVIHRVVHGGDKFIEPVLLSPVTIQELEKLNHIAPLHNPPAIEQIKILSYNFPELKQFAVFDTAFHQTLPKINQIYPLPIKAYTKYGIKRYGFHGLSHKYTSDRYYQLKTKFDEDENKTGNQLSLKNSSIITTKKDNLHRGKIVTIHLGSGSSLCAIMDGKSYQTSMGFSPNEGLPMGTRSGEINFDAINHYRTQENLSWEEIQALLNKKSGILGLSGYTSNMVTIVQDYYSNSAAKLTLDILVERVIEKLGGYIATLNGVEAIVFTGAVGEGSHLVRQKICRQFEYIGLNLDPEINAKSDEPSLPIKISSLLSKVEVWIIPTKEELQMLRDLEKLPKI